MLINGLGLDVASWTPQIDALARRFKVIAFDNRGTGRSHMAAPPYSTAQMAADTVALLDELGLDRPHVLGFSLGGLVAQELAISYPGRVRSLPADRRIRAFAVTRVPGTYQCARD